MISAAKNKNRPFDAVLVWKLSRFARNRYDSILYKAMLKRLGVQVISINEPIEDSPTGRMMEAIIEAVDEFYSDNLAEDVIRGMSENASKGFNNGGNITHGYKRVSVTVGEAQKSKLELEESEVPVVKRVFELGLTGYGEKEIAKLLNRDGMRTRTGKLWSKNKVNLILTNEVYTGTAVWKKPDGEIIRFTSAHPPVISQSDFGRLQYMIDDRKSTFRHPRTVHSRYLLSSLLHCKKCGAYMIGCSVKSGKFLYYRCNHGLRHDPKACDSGWLPKHKIESFIIEKLKDKIMTEDNLTQLVEMVNEENGQSAKKGQDRLVEIEQQLKLVSDKLFK